jgi:hypothetical protein
MRIRVGLVIAFATGVLAMLAPTDASQKVTAAPCTQGRYVITGNPRSTGRPTLKSGSITMRGATVSLSAGCPATLLKTKRMLGGKGLKKGATRVRAKWEQCSGVKGRVRLKAHVDSTCKRMWGSISTKRGKSRFDAQLSLCGNSVVDPGEQCDGAACSNGAACTDACECDLDGIPGPGCTPGVDGCPSDGGHSSTTTTIGTGGGGVVTTTSLGGGGGSTTTTINGGGGTTTTTIPSPPGDHFKCYKLRGGGHRFHPGPVGLVDQFGASASVAEEPERLCNPVDKEGEGITDPTAHLMCYDLAQEKGFQARDVVVRNQFGDQILTVVRPESLCVPATKDGVDSPLNLNHFKCYRVAQRHGKFPSRVVELADQFETKTTVVQKPLLMCNPVDKNGEGVVDPANHLTCYRIVDAAGQPDFLQRDVSVEDQFTEQLVTAFRGTCRKASLLCVPSEKNPGNPTTTTIRPSTTSTSQATPSTTSTSLGGSTTTSSTTTTSVGGSSTTLIGTTSTSATTTPVPTTSSTSTETPTTSSTSVATPTTSSTSTPVPTTSSTSTPTPTTSSTSAPAPTTSTSTSSTTSSTIGAQCCNNATNLRFLTANAPGDCGDIIDQGGMTVANINCAGLYTGGGGNSVPLPFAVPDLGDSITAISNCMTDVATIGATTSAQTGSNRNCTSAGCLFGAPLAVPNPGSTPTSVCVTNALAQAPQGQVNCATGETSLNAPLSSFLYLTGDTATDPMSTIPGIQPCPICSASTCIGGPNNGMACTAGTTALNASYPTSHDCPPDPMFNIGTLPVAFSLSTGTLTWSGTTATNDTGGTFSVQNRVFSGFCRDTDSSGAFQGSTAATAVQCWENGMAVGAPCSGTFESCEQRTNGAFGPAGGANRTIRAIGNAMSLSGGSATATLVSLFSIRPTFDPTVDSAGDLPGPGAVALPGTAFLCNNAMCTP